MFCSELVTFIKEDWSFVRKTYCDAHSKTGKLTNLVKWAHSIECTPLNFENFICISEFRIRGCWMDPPELSSGGNFGNLLFHVLSNDVCKFAINLSPITWGPFEMLIYSIFYWECRFEMAVMCLILQETHKRYQCKSFISEFKMKSCAMDPPHFGKIFNFISDFKSCGMDSLSWYLVEILENLLFHVLSNDVCKFAINLFPITWGPFENVNLLYFLLGMQIWNGCNVLNIAGNPIKDINVNLSFLSSRWKVVQWTPHLGKSFNFISEFKSSKVVEWTP